MPKPVALKHLLDADRARLYEGLISELTDSVVFFVDDDGCITSWNTGVERILGFTEAEWLGQPVDIIFTPEDLLWDVPRQELASALNLGKVSEGRWHIRKDGSRLFVEGTTIVVRDNQGEVLGFSKVLRDITERKHRETQLQDALSYAEAIVDTVREPLLVLDSELRIRSANHCFRRVFQVSKEETENQRIFDLRNGQWEIPQFRILLEELIPQQATIEDFEVEHTFPGLGHKIMLFNARKLWREWNHTELTLLAIEDITEQKQAAKALDESEKQQRLIVDAAPAIISYIDRDLRYRLANSTYQHWFGRTSSDMVGKTVLEVFGSTIFASVESRIKSALKGETVSFEQDYPSPNGFLTLQVAYTPDRNERGEVQGFVVLGSDITARKRAETALRQSEDRWRSLFERMTEGFFLGEMLYDSSGRAADFRFLEVNPAFEMLTGLSNVGGKTVRQVVPGIQDELIARYARVVGTGESEHFEVFVPALQENWYEIRARRTESGRFAVLFLNITERKNTEVQWRESESRQAAIVTLGDRLRDLTDIPSLTSAAMEIVGVTLGVARAGYGTVDATQEFVTINDDWTNGAIGTLAGSYRFSDFGEGLGDRLRRGESFAISDVSTHPITARDKKRWEALDIRAVINLPLLENGRLVALLFIQDSAPRTWTESDLAFIRKVADRTWAAAERARALQELQQNEEFTRSILASSPDCIKVIDLEGRLLTMNEGGCRQMEIDNLAACVNQPWTDFWGQSQERAERALRHAKAGQTSRFEAYCPTAKGIPKWWEVVVTPIVDSSGHTVRILSLSRDITERKGDDQERERLTKELQRSNEDLSQFAHTVAHDLQSPLRGVTSFAQLLQRNAGGRLVEKDLEFLKHIVESARRMGELVQALLRFAQVGQGQIEKEPVAMQLVLDAALQSLQLQIEEAGAKITRSILPDVIGDSVQLVQLFQNLIGNALKYRRPDILPTVNIKADQEGSSYVFRIADNGEGIAREDLQRIFEPLKRLHGADVPGTGLGLAMCQRIVSRHGGRVWVESQPGLGSTFFFMLPGV